MRGLAFFAAGLLFLACSLPARSADHSRFRPDPAAARFWTRRVFGHGWQGRLMLCVAYRESRFELGVSSGTSWGPWQIYRSETIHPWLNTYRVTHSWRYAARAAHRVAWHPPKNGQRGYYDFGPWSDGCAS